MASVVPSTIYQHVIELKVKCPYGHELDQIPVFRNVLPNLGLNLMA